MSLLQTRFLVLDPHRQADNCMLETSLCKSKSLDSCGAAILSRIQTNSKTQKPFYSPYSLFESHEKAAQWIATRNPHQRYFAVYIPHDVPLFPRFDLDLAHPLEHVTPLQLREALVQVWLHVLLENPEHHACLHQRHLTVQHIASNFIITRADYKDKLSIHLHYHKRAKPTMVYESAAHEAAVVDRMKQVLEEAYQDPTHTFHVQAQWLVVPEKNPQKKLLHHLIDSQIYRIVHWKPPLTHKPQGKPQIPLLTCPGGGGVIPLTAKASKQACSHWIWQGMPQAPRDLLLQTETTNTKPNVIILRWSHVPLRPMNRLSQAPNSPIPWALVMEIVRSIDSMSQVKYEGQFGSFICYRILPQGIQGRLCVACSATEGYCIYHQHNTAMLKFGTVTRGVWYYCFKARCTSRLSHDWTSDLAVGTA